MFNRVSEDTGWIEVIVGSMFSGKTEELISRLRRAQIAKQEVAIFKHVNDNARFSDRSLVSHSKHEIPSVSVENASEILERSNGAKVIGIDEGQFFDAELVSVCEHLADQGRRVVVAGLDMDFQREPYETIILLLAAAESITKALAVCVVCGNSASRTQRRTEETNRTVVGAENYEARCRKCFRPPNKTT